MSASISGGSQGGTIDLGGTENVSPNTATTSTGHGGHIVGSGDGSSRALGGASANQTLVGASAKNIEVAPLKMPDVKLENQEPSKGIWPSGGIAMALDMAFAAEVNAADQTMLQAATAQNLFMNSEMDQAKEACNDEKQAAVDQLIGTELKDAIGLVGSIASVGTGSEGWSSMGSALGSAVEAPFTFGAQTLQADAGYLKTGSGVAGQASSQEASVKSSAEDQVMKILDNRTELMKANNATWNINYNR